MMLQWLERRKEHDAYRKSTDPEWLLRERVYEYVALAIDDFENLVRGGSFNYQDREEKLKRIQQRIHGLPWKSDSAPRIHNFHAELVFNATVKHLTAALIQEIELYRESFPDQFLLRRLPLDGGAVLMTPDQLRICRHCGCEAVLVTGERIYPHRPDLFVKNFWLCQCGAYVGTHPGTTTPLGNPSNAELRRAKAEAHGAFDQLWKRGSMGRKAAYKWLAGKLEIPFEQTHIGWFDVAMCEKVMAVCREKLLQATANVVERGGANTCGRCGWVITAGPAGCHETETGSGVVVCVAPEQR